jgi:hypothetical protein
MNADIFSEWLRRQGRRVLRTPSSYWHEQGPRTYQAFPYHWMIEPSERELSELLQQHRAIALRYSTLPQAAVGRVSYHVVYDGRTYGLDQLSANARSNVRRGLRNCLVEPISLKRLADEGWRLCLDTLQRQGRDPQISQEAWQILCLAAGELPGFEAWGALVRGRLAASLITFQMDHCCYVLYPQCAREHMAAHVNNALSYAMTQAMIGRPMIGSIFYGLHSLDAPPSVDEFKLRMGYTAKPVRQRVVFHPWLAPLCNGASHAVLRQLLALKPGDRTLAKTEGMIRFYLEGRRPVEEQDLPEPLQTLSARVDRLAEMGTLTPGPSPTAGERGGAPRPGTEALGEADAT